MADGIDRILEWTRPSSPNLYAPLSIPAGSGRRPSTTRSSRAPLVAPLLDAAGVAGGTQVLDLCCGTGLFTAAAARRAAAPIGVDFSSAILAVARPAHPFLRFYDGDVQALPYPNRYLRA